MSKDDLFRWDRSEAEGSEFDESGFLSVQVNNCTGGGELGAWAHSPYGLLSRPLDPDGEGACHVLVAAEGDQKHAIATVDLRVLKKLPQPKKGGSIQYGSDGAFGTFDPETHTRTLYVPVDFDDAGTPTKAHLVQIGKDANGKRCITILHADGQAISMLEGGKRSVVIKNAESTAYLEVNDDGLVLNGNTVVKGSLQSNEGAPGVQPLARATELLTFAADLVVKLNACIAAINALAPGSVPGPVLPLAPSVASMSHVG